ncbi:MULTISPECIES: response regulator transcription factor [Olivibacter]|uniref:Two component transcriptional regulator, winged helix family n=2 Tax=Sphingobacteriaceae TaxID=84566 RepID=F4CBL9_SPHS2|nr:MULTISPECIES: response regulator transcription factor [Olivibacter]MDM8176776.1 response regulator transcription factor [Olivibacter sp. 47]QEL00591.1 response regulator transcription factor [Olivibacter sp. LS-1]
MKHSLLFVEDEQDLGNVVKQYLEFMNFNVIWCMSAHEALLHYQQSHSYDLLIIDVQLPDYNGFELAEKIIKENKTQAFLFLTARNEKKDRIHGLHIGADDYINKPFDIDELVLRIKNIIKRNNKEIRPEILPGELQIGDLIFQKELLKLSLPNKKAVSLTLREAELLEYLHLNSNRILKREEILLHLWGENDYFLGRSLDVFISRLRKALTHSTRVNIENVYGVGFIFSVS